jgi:hypothetical protein
MAAAQTIYAATVADLLPPYIRKDRGWLPESWRKVFAESLGDVQAFLEAWHDFVSAFYEVSSGNLRAVLFDKLDHARPPDLNETKWEASITASPRASSDEQYQFGQEVWEAYLLDCDNDIIYDQTNTLGRSSTVPFCK